MDSSLDPNFTTHFFYACITFLLNIGGFFMLLALLIGSVITGDVRKRYKAIYLIIAMGLAIRAIQQLGTLIGYDIYAGNGIYWAVMKDLGIYLWIACNLVDYQKAAKLRKDAEKRGECVHERRSSDRKTGFQSIS